MSLSLENVSETCAINILSERSILIILNSLFPETEFCWLFNSPERDIYRLKPPFQTAGFFPNKISFFFSPLWHKFLHVTTQIQIMFKAHTLRSEEFSFLL